MPSDGLRARRGCPRAIIRQRFLAMGMRRYVLPETPRAKVTEVRTFAGDATIQYFHRADIAKHITWRWLEQ